MIQSLAGEAETGCHIFRFEVRQFFEHLLAGEAGSQEIQDVADADTHPSDARPSATLFRGHGDACDAVGHRLPAPVVGNNSPQWASSTVRRIHKDICSFKPPRDSFRVYTGLAQPKLSRGSCEPRVSERSAFATLRPDAFLASLRRTCWSTLATLRPDAFLASLRRTAFACTGLASRSSREESGEPDRERRLVPEEGIEPTRRVNPTGF